MTKDFWAAGPWGLLGAVVIALWIERTVLCHDLQFCRTENIDLRMARHAAHATRMAVSSDILCLGSSMIQQGILPRVIERRTGRKVYNLAVCGGPVQHAYYTLRQALMAGARPSAVLIDFHPAFITYRPEVRGHVWADALDVRECFDMARALRDPDIFTSAAVAKTLPTLYYRHDVRAWVAAAFDGRDYSHEMGNLLQMRNLNRNHGARVCEKNPAYRGEVSAILRGFLLGDVRPCDPDESLYIHRLIDLAAAHGVRVCWVIFPFAPALQSEREAKGLDAAYTGIVREFTGHPNLVVLDARRSGYNASVFTDASHLDLEGSATLSNDVADVLLRAADSPNWVFLPPFRKTSIDVSIETVDETYTALFERSTVRK